MVVFHPEPTPTPKPEYWWREAEGCGRALRELVKVSDTAEIRAIICDKCHGLLERSAKAILSEQGRLEDSDRTHSLRRLFTKAGIYADLDEDGKRLISEISNLHHACTYPDEDSTSETWYDVDECQRVLTKSLLIYSTLRERPEDAEGGEQDGSGRDR